MAEKNERCAAEVWSGFRSHRCSARGKLEHDGKWWCKTHHPPTLAARREARDNARREQEERAHERRKQAEAERRAADLRNTSDNDLAAECARRGWEVTRG